MLYINKIKSIIRKYMARPKTIKLASGTVELHGFPKELSAALATYIEDYDRVKNSGAMQVFAATEIKRPAAEPVDAIYTDETYAQQLVTAEPTTLASRTIGTNLDGGEFHLVTVAYDLITKECRVEKVEKAGSLRDVSTQFKIAADKYKFV